MLICNFVFCDRGCKFKLTGAMDEPPPVNGSYLVDFNDFVSFKAVKVAIVQGFKVYCSLSVWDKEQHTKWIRIKDK